MTARDPRAPKFPLPLERLTPANRARATPPAPAGAISAPRAVLRPQQPLQHAAQAAARKGAPTGLGLDSIEVRHNMVERVRAGGIANEPVLTALAAVPRHRFVDPALVTQAYEDTSLPIGHGQTISKPSVVARMLALLYEGSNAKARGTLGRVLEIGTGCGYQAALLAQLSKQVYSVERLKPLHDKARAHLALLREHRIRLVYGDGRHGHPPNAPYDSIIAAAGGDDLPAQWLEQLAPGGRLVAPMHDARAGVQVLIVVDRDGDGYVRSCHEAVLFVPLKFGLD
jgi:protein-L-isoaspartate(D-aspartate) O-methyltransferase